MGIIMQFFKKRKAKQHLDKIWRSMEMSCENNYKDLAHESLKEFEECLEKYYNDGLISQSEYNSNSQKLSSQKSKLQGYTYNHHPIC